MLADLTALVTNVRHFVGLATARELAAHNARVVCHDVSFQHEDSVRAFREENPGLFATPEQEARSIVDHVTDAFGSVDILVNNAAYPAIRAPVDEADADQMRAGLEALIMRPFALTGAVVPQMKARRQGKIVFVTSAAPFRGLPNYGMYVAARGGANALALSLAKELARFNIQVNAVAPNFVESPTYFPQALLDDPEALKKIVANIPLGRLGKPDEVAAAIAFLASERSDFITGLCLPVAGGWA